MGLTGKDIQNLIAEHEAGHGCKVHSTRFEHGKVVSIQCRPWPSRPYWINCFHMTPSLVEEKTTDEGHTTYNHTIPIPPEVDGVVHDLLVETVYDAGGSISRSGFYPFPKEVLVKLRELGVIP